MGEEELSCLEEDYFRGPVEKTFNYLGIYKIHYSCNISHCDFQKCKHRLHLCHKCTPDDFSNILFFYEDEVKGVGWWPQVFWMWSNMLSEPTRKKSLLFFTRQLIFLFNWQLRYFNWLLCLLIPTGISTAVFCSGTSTEIYFIVYCSNWNPSLTAFSAYTSTDTSTNFRYLSWLLVNWHFKLFLALQIQLIL